MTSAKQIIYIIGAGRSGTTLLDVILGNAGGYRSCGELNRIPKRGAVPPEVEAGSDAARYWDEVLGVIRSENDMDALAKDHHSLEHHKGCLARLVGSGRKPSKNYVRYLEQLYTTLFGRAGSDRLIESSKYPGRALLLSELFGDRLDIRFIYIKRDPVSVIESFAKKDIEQPGKSFLGALSFYNGVNLLCQRACARLRKKHRVTEVAYEELVQHPARTLDRIAREIDLSLGDLGHRLETGDALQVGQLFDGNRLRLKETLQVKPMGNPNSGPIKRGLIRLMTFPFYP